MVRRTSKTGNAQKLGDHQGDLWAQMMQMGQTLRLARYDEGEEKVMAAFRAIRDWEKSQDGPPPLEKLEKAKTLFFGLAEYRRRELLNGWSSDSDWPASAEVRESICNVNRFVILHPLILSPDWAVIGYEENPRPVEFGGVKVCVGQGMKLADTITALETAFDRLKRHWKRLITMEG